MPQDWDLGLEARIWASRLRYGPGGWREGGTKKEEKIPHMRESIGHRLLRGRCPKGKEWGSMKKETDLVLVEVDHRPVIQ